MKKIKVSIVIPVFNEEDNIKPLYEEIIDALKVLNNEYEIIFVNDGSRDRTRDKIEEIISFDKRVKLIDFRKNYGQTAAISAGIDYSKGEYIVTIDGDLQNDPKDIPRMLKELEEKKLDLLNGWRYKRKDPFISRRLPSIIANWLISMTTGVKLHDYGCTLKVIKREIAKSLNLYGELHRFIPALAEIEGARIGETKVNHRERKHGKSKYGISRTIRVILDLLTVKFLSGYSTKPLQIFGFWGMLTGGTGTIIGLYLAYVRFILKKGIWGRPLLFLSMLLIFMGVQLVSLGLLGEMISRTYHESSKKRIYRVREVVGIEEDGEK